jgi:hypothetical protein
VIVKHNFVTDDYCSTCHSSHGASIDGNVTIFDYKHKLVTWRWLWTAITRATHLDGVYYYIYNNNKDDEFNTTSLRS